jgi:nucleoid-associated protein YgaU
MGCARQAVLEFDEAVQAPWRPRLVPAGGGSFEQEPPPAGANRPHPSRRSPSRVGACRPDGPGGPEVLLARRGGVTPVGASSPRRSASVRPSPVRPAPARLRLTRRARRLAVVVALTSGVAVGSWLGSLLGGGGGDLRLAGADSVVVQPGDTLWSIAGSLGGDGDIRALVDAIQELNGLSGTHLSPGQVLVLP